MGKYISGIVLLVLFALSFLGAVMKPDADSGTAVAGALFLFALPGAILFYFGRKAIRISKLIIERALEVLREQGSIDVPTVCEQTGTGEIEVRKVLSKAKQDGVIPYKAEVK